MERLGTKRKCSGQRSSDHGMALMNRPVAEADEEGEGMVAVQTVGVDNTSLVVGFSSFRLYGAMPKSNVPIQTRFGLRGECDLREHSLYRQSQDTALPTGTSAAGDRAIARTQL